MTEDEVLINTLECILFAAKEPVPVPRLAEAIGQEATAVPSLLERLGERLHGTGLQVIALAGGYSLATRSEFAEAVQRFLEPDPEKLSVQALETLAIIAYNQPLTRPEIDEVRGVNSSGAVNSLIEKGLVRVAGRKDAPGRPFLLETTPYFLSVFGLSSLDDLPSISNLRHMMEQQRGLLLEGEPAPPATDSGDPPAEPGEAETSEDEIAGADGADQE